VGDELVGHAWDGVEAAGELDAGETQRGLVDVADDEAEAFEDHLDDDEVAVLGAVGGF
jgi:hypothetical protein